MLKDRYQLLGKIGEGSMGIVHRAMDKSNNRLVAIKQCTSSTKNAKNIERFKREYQFLSQNQHQNIVKALDLFESGKSNYLVLEYIEGITLGDLIYNHPRSISFNDQMKIAIQICDGIAFLNNRGIIHRDLKPDNIILSENNVPHILDLGIAKSQATDMDSLTSTGSIVGTISYMSPEQFANKDSKKIDVFSLCIVLYQFFAWLPGSPFQGKNFSDTMARILKMTLPSFSIYTQKNDLHHKTIANFLQAGMNKNPNKRIDINQLHTSLTHTYRGKNIEQLHELSLKINNKPNAMSLRFLTFVFAIFVLLVIYTFGIAKKTLPQNLPKSNSVTTLQKLYDNKNYAQVIHLLKNRDHLSTIELYLRANSYQRTKKYENAIQDYNACLQKKPVFFRAYVNRGLMWMKLREYDKAEEDFNLAIPHYPKSSFLHYKRGLLYQRNKRYKKALQNYKKALQINSKYVDVYVNVGDIYFKQKLYKKSITNYSKALEIKQNYAKAYFHRGVAYHKIQMHKEAKKDFFMARKQNNNYAKKIKRYYPKK
ncbi:protein kinase [Candidatus Uabimicrobium sp. HlEnr_7]|uniref:serine/threonine-protein kinase n=1 Tax=Candidatus Uabimicrobium helgolandensis TaxID=3095367 RepID=UPI00355608E7